MSIENITFLLSLDNFVYGVVTSALDNHPFDVIMKIAVGNTYLLGVLTHKVFAMSVDIEEIISNASNGVKFAPLFINNTQLEKVITTNCDNLEPHTSRYIDVERVNNDTQNVLKGNMDKAFISFCNEFIDDYEAPQNDDIFDSLKDYDMMVQCDILLNDIEPDCMSCE